MKFRIARHTADLQPIIHFYCGILGLDILGEFKNHDDYDGVFIGKGNLGWHLEFTVSGELPDHRPDEDDLLVFYPESMVEFNTIRQQFSTYDISEVKPKNPYWAENGITYVDPDGFRIVIAKPQS
ncbi:MAG TPA: VOC family protein [Flavobacterium sp.]|nr:VOC family protein [Flavobacterium sp.]